MTSPGCFGGRSCFLLCLVIETVCLYYPNRLPTCDLPSFLSLLGVGIICAFIAPWPAQQTPCRKYRRRGHEKLHSSCSEFKVITPLKPPANWASSWIMRPSLKETVNDSAFGFESSDQRKPNMEQVPLKEVTVSFVGFPRIALYHYC